MESKKEGLECINDNCKSFYGKAEVIISKDKKTLLSYNTEVAHIFDGRAVVTDTYSQTTLRHIKEFLLQNGFKADNKEQILNDYKGVEK